MALYILNTVKRFHHHFAVHHHNGVQSRAHLISLGALFVYLQLLAVFAFGVYVIHSATSRILGAVTFTPAEIITLTNEKRVQNGLANLAENSQLDAAARAKSADMFAFDYWAHYSPQGKSPWQFINAAGYKYTFAGENLARDFEDARSVVDAWIGSPSHRSNLLDSNFREIGVAVDSGKLGGREGILVVQMFGASPQSPIAEIPNTKYQIPNSQSQVAGEQEGAVGDVGAIRGIGEFGLAKVVTLGLTGFIFMLFVFELVYSVRASHLRLQSAVLAHTLLLGFVLAVLWYSTAGAIK